jgi:hypothetical protein
LSTESKGSSASAQTTKEDETLRILAENNKILRENNQLMKEIKDMLRKIAINTSS